ncbi:hypothetical protein ACSHWO_36485 (plasmid) [Streptomyces sp. HUAS TT3]|uniref:hypothetical protein n=1 Tax=Streptomyces sp. HUAS TT3 TaxID=3447510 RepID=UPI003F65836A
MEDIATNGLPSVDACTPGEELREQHLAASPPRRLAALPPCRPASRRRLTAARYGRRHPRIAFCDPGVAQPENITSEAEVHALDRPRSGP